MAKEEKKILSFHTQKKKKIYTSEWIVNWWWSLNFEYLAMEWENERQIDTEKKSLDHLMRNHHQREWRWNVLASFILPLSTGCLNSNLSPSFIRLSFHSPTAVVLLPLCHSNIFLEWIAVNYWNIDWMRFEVGKYKKKSKLYTRIFMAS